MLKKYLMIFLVSMVPLIELRGAVPIAVGMNLPLLPSYIICILGSTGMGCGQAGHRQVLYLLPGKRT